MEAIPPSRQALREALELSESILKNIELSELLLLKASLDQADSLRLLAVSLRISATD